MCATLFTDAGLKTYRVYWYAVIMSYLRERIYNNESIDLVGIKESTGVDMQDILETLIIADMTFISDGKLHINIVSCTLRYLARTHALLCYSRRYRNTRCSAICVGAISSRVCLK